MMDHLLVALQLYADIFSGRTDVLGRTAASGLGRINTRVPTITPTISPTFSPTFSPLIGSRTMSSLATNAQTYRTERRKAPVDHSHRSSEDSDSDSDLSPDSNSDSYSDTESDSNSDSKSRSDSDWDSEDGRKSPIFSLKTQGTSKGIYRAFKKHGGVSLISELVNGFSERFL